MGKYSFSDTTIGEILDNAETYELFAKLAPEAIDHPMLDMGRPLTVEQALPFIEAIADSMGIETLDERAEGFKAALEAL